MRRLIALAAVLLAPATVAAGAAPHDHGVVATVLSEQLKLGKGDYRELELECPAGTVMTELVGSFAQITGTRPLPLLDVHSHRVVEGGVLAQNTTKRRARMTANAQCISLEPAEDGSHPLKVGKVQNYTVDVRRGRTAKVRANCAPEQVAVVPGYQWVRRPAGRIVRSQPVVTQGTGHEFSVRGERTGRVTLSVRCMSLAAGPHALQPAVTGLQPQQIPPGSALDLPVDCGGGARPLVSTWDLPAGLHVERITVTPTGRTIRVRNTGGTGALASVGVLCLAPRTTVAS